MGTLTLRLGAPGTTGTGALTPSPVAAATSVASPVLTPPAPGPVISGVSSFGKTTSSIWWQWDVAATAKGYIEYGTAGAGGPFPSQTSHEDNLLPHHEQLVTGLAPNTTYYGNLVATGPGGQVVKYAIAWTTNAAVAGSYPIPAVITYIAPPAVTLPAKGVKTFDAATNTWYTRIDDGPAGGPVYPRHQPWSGALVGGTPQYLLDWYGHQILDGTTYAFVRSWSANEARWAMRRPVNGVASTAAESWLFDIQGTTFGYYTVTDGAWHPIRTFTGWASFWFGKYEGSHSWDDRFFPFVGTTTGGTPQIMVYDRIADSFVSRTLTALPDSFGLSPTGLWAYTTGGPGGCILYRCDTLAQVRVLNGDGSNHGDTGFDANGKEIFVYTYNGGGDANLAGVWSYRMDQSTSSFDVGRLLPPGAISRSYQQGHVSLKALDRPGMAILSPYNSADWGTAPGRGRVMGVLTDGSAFSSQMGEDWGFHWSDSANRGNGVGYDKLPFAVPDQKGERIFIHSKFVSNGADGGPHYGVILEAS